MVRTVVRTPSRALGTAGAVIDPCDPATVQLAADLAVTMRAAPGCVGLAAPQVGQPAQVFVVDVSAHPRAHTCHGIIALCNARVVDASQWRRGREGCMSVPDFTGDVRRAGRVMVTGQQPGSGEEIELTTDAFEARALQHEIDHCSGLLFLDRVAGAHAVYRRTVYL
ncbi:MAG TPA: peptide deformylase [Pilimelia sp.]|nr:peptide deformylase [Pilimelia sp.]